MEPFTKKNKYFISKFKIISKKYLDVVKYVRYEPAYF
jgi:hypothetical protein